MKESDKLKDGHKMQQRQGIQVDAPPVKSMCQKTKYFTVNR